MPTFTVPDFGPNDLLTSDRIGTRRIAVDSQQTSYEDNAQFRFFDYFGVVAKSDQLVYVITTTNPINIFSRIIDLVSGGREFLVFPATGNETFTGTLVDVSDEIFPISMILRDGLTTHPTSGVTFQKAEGPDIFESTDNPINGTFVLTSGNGSNKSSTYSQSGDRAGVGGNATFYLVFNDFAEVANEGTHGMFTFKWEERF